MPDHISSAIPKNLLESEANQTKNLQSSKFIASENNIFERSADNRASKKEDEPERDEDYANFETVKLVIDAIKTVINFSLNIMMRSFWGVSRFLGVESYSGDLRFGKQHGKGAMKYANGDTYTGDWKDGKRHGCGTVKYANGDTYTGDWKDGERHGKGTYTFANGNTYTGDWEDSQLHGHGTLEYGDGTKIEGAFINGFPVSDNKSLGNLKFMGLLTGMLSASSGTYTWGTVGGFLETQGIRASKELASANKILMSSESKEKTAEQILERLKKDDSQLLHYGYKEHSMALKIRPIDDGHYYFEIYNSGDGLRYHPVTTNETGTSLYQTMLRYKVPKRSLNKNLLTKILNHKSFDNVNESYLTISRIPGARKIDPKPFEATWQREQKSGNCSLESAFAYLRNTMGLHDYTRMRRKLYEAALEAIEKQTIDEPHQKIKLENLEQELTTLEAYQRIKSELERKLHKSLFIENPIINDFTGAIQARLEALTKAKEDVKDESVKKRREALAVFKILVDKGEAIPEATLVAELLEKDKDRGIQLGAERLKRKINHHSL